MSLRCVSAWIHQTANGTELVRPQRYEQILQIQAEGTPGRLTLPATLLVTASLPGVLFLDRKLEGQEILNSLSGRSLSCQAEGLPGRLTLHSADLSQEGSFDEAVSGCSFICHVASPVIMKVHKAFPARTRCHCPHGILTCQAYSFGCKPKGVEDWFLNFIGFWVKDRGLTRRRKKESVELREQVLPNPRGRPILWRCVPWPTCRAGTPRRRW